MVPSIKSLASLALLTILFLLPVSVFAFKPTEAGHLGITQIALDTIAWPVGGQTYKFTPKATGQVKDANRAVDLIPGTPLPNYTSLFSSYHFDNEDLEGGSQRLMNLKKRIIDEITTSHPDGKSARKDLGGALHTLQDFYAHSNWVELKHTDIDMDLGRSLIPNPSVFAATTTNPIPGLRSLDTSIGFLTTGYFEVFTPLGGLNFPGFGGLNPLKADHGIGVLAPLLGSLGMNKDDDSRVGFQAAHDLAVEATKDFVKQILMDDAVKDNAKAVRALMGIGTLAIVIDTTGSMNDIQDEVKQEAIAIVNARLGTEDEPSEYILGTFNDPDVPEPLVTNDPDAFKAAISALPANGGGDCPEMSEHGMYGTISVMGGGGDLFMFTDADAKDADLAGAVDALAEKNDVQLYCTIYDGCSAYSDSADVVARYIKSAGGADRSWNTAVKRLISRGIKITFDHPKAPGGLLSRLSPHARPNVDPTYTKNAQETGGQVFKLVRTEAGAVTKLANLTTHTDFVSLLSVNDTLIGAAKTYTVPVDSTMTTVNFSVSGTTGVTIQRPDGTPVKTTDADTAFVLLTSGAIYSVSHPGVGLWTVIVKGSSNFSLSVSGRSPLDFVRLDFVTPGGRPAHEGYFPIDGQPVAGSRNTAEVTLTGGFKLAQFDARDKTGAVLETLAIPSASDTVFRGDVTLPSQAAHIYVTGADANGNPFQRLLPAIVKAQSVSVTAPSPQSLMLGQTVQYTFHVTNSGAADTFAFSGLDDKKYLGTISVPSFQLGAGESKDVAIQLSVPADAQVDVLDNLTVTVQSTTNSDSANSAGVTSRTVTAAIHTFPSGLQMISAPYDYSDVPFSAIFSSPSDGLITWMPSLSQYVFTPVEPADTFHIGHAYWARFGVSADLLKAGAVTGTTAPFLLTLSPGWNMIGDPFGTPINVEDLRARDLSGNDHTLLDAARFNAVSPILYSYDTATKRYTPLSSGALQPYVGYWIKSFYKLPLVFPVPKAN